MQDAVLVTGGAGYIGSHAMYVLKQRGFSPICLDDLSNGRRDAAKWGHFIQGSLADRALIDDIMRTYRPKAVLHFAGRIEAGASVGHPNEFYSANVVNSLNILESMREFSVENIIFSSTAAVYGNPISVPIREDHPISPVSPYGRTKFFVEKMIEDFSAAFGIRYAALRYFNAAGGRPEIGLFEAHDPETHLIPLALDAASGRRGKLLVFGDDYPTPDGSCVRDYVHVMDLAEAHVLALEFLLATSDSIVANLGNGEGLSVFDILSAVARTVGRDVPFDIAPRRPGDPEVLVADCSRAHEQLGWTPQFSSVDQIVSDAFSGRDAFHQA